LGSVESPGRGSGRCPGGQAEVGEDVRNDGAMFDGGDDLQRAAATGAVFQVDIEHPLEQPGPAQAGRRCGRGASAWSAEGVWVLTGTVGMILGRILAL
jgi:hypothetical protein